MATWIVEYYPNLNRDPDDADAILEIPCFRIFPEGEPQRWIVQTNPNLPLDLQEESAHLIAEALLSILGA